MELLLTDEQRLLQDSVRKLLAQAGGVKRTRELRGKADGFEPALHARMGDEGWFGLLVSPDAGGLGLGLTEFGLVLMEAGRVLAPEPIAAAVACASIISRAAAGRRSADLLAGIVEGRVIVMPAIDGDGLLQRSSPNLRWSGSAGEARFDGVCDGVPMASACDGFLVAAEGAKGSCIAYVPRDAKGLTISSCNTVDGRPRAQLTLNGVASEKVIAVDGEGTALHRALNDMLLFAAAAELVGVMSAALDITVEYLKTRKQFGKPIGSFQALQHRAVDDFARMVSVRSFVFQVAGQGSELSSSMASALKAHAGAKALEVTKSAIQMHGAIGFTEDCDIGLYLKRAMWLSVWLGNEAHHRRRYAALQA